MWSSATEEGLKTCADIQSEPDVDVGVYYEEDQEDNLGGLDWGPDTLTHHEMQIWNLLHQEPIPVDLHEDGPFLVDPIEVGPIAVDPIEDGPFPITSFRSPVLCSICGVLFFAQMELPHSPVP